jgi:sialate O-acetylesterase
MKKSYILLLFSFCIPLFLTAKIELPKLVGNHMVLQRNSSINLWGKSTIGKEVIIKTSWNSKVYKTESDKNGDWITKVETSDAGGPYTISISDGDEIILHDILLGEVWICSGQSNMEFPVCGFMNQYNEDALQTILESTKYPNIRLFTVGRNSTGKPQKDCISGEWKIAGYESVSAFSAVAYYFGRMLNDALDVPVGLISTNWGGSKIEAWMTEESISKLPDIDQEIAFSGKRSENKPAALYNGMIHPLVNYTAKGFIWYQGESNREAYFDYKDLLTEMIYLWRSLWKNDKMPFYFVQLAPYNYDGADLRSLPLTIEAQMQVAENVSHTGIAATTDLGHQSNIHPPKKKDVGSRLAFLALKHDYGIKGLPLDAPTFKSMEIKDSSITLSFNNVSEANNFTAPNSLAGFDNIHIHPVNGFEIAGEDKVFYPANAKLLWRKNQIEVSSDNVKHPVAVRYAFRNFPKANVATTFGIPLIPFRTDNWPVPDNEIFKK